MKPRMRSSVSVVMRPPSGVAIKPNGKREQPIGFPAVVQPRLGRAVPEQVLPHSDPGILHGGDVPADPIDRRPRSTEHVDPSGLRMPFQMRPLGRVGPGQQADLAVP